MQRLSVNGVGEIRNAEHQSLLKAVEDIVHVRRVEFLTNLQNIPSHNKDIRQMFSASPGYYLVSGDYSLPKLAVVKLS